MNNLKSKLLFAFFQICGFCHFTSLAKLPTTGAKRFLCIWSCFHLFVISLLVLVSIYYAKHIFMLRDIITAFTDIFQWALPVLTQFIIIIESLCTINIQYRFCARIRYIDQLLLRTSAQLKTKLLNRFALKCVVLVVTTIGVDIFIFMRVQNDENWRNDLVTSFYSLIVCRSRILFLTFFIDTLRCRVEMLTMRLKDVRFNSKSRLNLLRCCKKSFGILWLATEDLNNAFGEVIW